MCQDEIPVLGVTVGDFWAYSDILNNTDRAVFAEFVVGMALGVTDAPRVEWDAVDLRYRRCSYGSPDRARHGRVFRRRLQAGHARVHRVCVRKRTYRRADFTVPDNTRKALVSSSCSYRPGP